MGFSNTYSFDMQRMSYMENFTKLVEFIVYLINFLRELFKKNQDAQ